MTRPDVRAAAHSALHALPHDLRDVFDRARLGATYAEIAAATGTSYESVRRRAALACLSVGSAMKPVQRSTGVTPPR
jgi:DNA-directed RNA polymerase specialized sigma24 family protein